LSKGSHKQEYNFGEGEKCSCGSSNLARYGLMQFSCNCTFCLPQIALIYVVRYWKWCYFSWI